MKKNILMTVTLLMLGAVAFANNQQNMALRKMNVAPQQSDNILLGRIGSGQDMDIVMKELAAAGFNVSLKGDDTIEADVTGMDAAQEALGLAKFCYVEQVYVSRKVYDMLFAVS